MELERVSIMSTMDDYSCVNFENFKEFEKELPKQAKELMDYAEEGEWQDNEINVYYDISGYADYEVREGWYADLLNCDLAELNYHGAPSLYGYIDFDKLGQDLIDAGDPTCTFETSDHKVIETSYGWDIR